MSTYDSTYSQRQTRTKQFWKSFTWTKYWSQVSELTVEKRCQRFARSTAEFEGIFSWIEYISIDELRNDCKNSLMFCLFPEWKCIIRRKKPMISIRVMQLHLNLTKEYFTTYRTKNKRKHVPFSEVYTSEAHVYSKFGAVWNFWNYKTRTETQSRS